MGLDWSTFLLELVNFLILLWILKRFLYAPVMAAVERRRRRVEAELADAEARRAEAQQLLRDYEAREQAWEQERAQAEAMLEQEMSAERARRLEQIRAELEHESAKAAALDQRHSRDAERQAQQASLALAADFAARLLSRFADPELEARLVRLVLEDLPQLAEGQRQTLDRAAREGDTEVRVLSAYPLREDQRRAIETALSAAVGSPLSCAFAQDPTLVAGLEIGAGPLIMRANLRDELRWFAEAGR